MLKPQMDSIEALDFDPEPACQCSRGLHGDDDVRADWYIDGHCRVVAFCDSCVRLYQESARVNGVTFYCTVCPANGLALRILGPVRSGGAS